MNEVARRGPHPASAGLAVGIDESLVRSVVEKFYAKVRRDPLLGRIFNQLVEDWPDHINRLGAFWSSLTLMTGRYKGEPQAARAWPNPFPNLAWIVRRNAR